MKKITLASALALLAVTGAAMAQTDAPVPSEVGPSEVAATVDAAIFPEPQAGFVRHVLPVAAQESEDNYLVEIVAGLTMEVDCNRVMISADLDDETLQGWGYSYYEIKDVSQPASTRMGCPDNSKTEQLVRLNLGSDALIRYNSKLPVVIYAPETLEVGYRIWTTDGEIHGAAK